ncbi:MAG: hypothetical protein JST32_19700 [Bacteroidetes bacterium]|nr:hypothetical protein [Bacteroidota bacterium]
MKSYRKASTSKLITRFDHELKTLLLSDLHNVRGVQNQHVHSNNQVKLQTRLSVA